MGGKEAKIISAPKEAEVERLCDEIMGIAGLREKILVAIVEGSEEEPATTE